MIGVFQYLSMLEILYIIQRVKTNILLNNCCMLFRS